MLNRLQKSMAEKDKGFTLIELLVVVIIIGILAGIAIPVFLNQRKKGVEAGVKSDLRNAATQLEAVTTDNPTWTAAAAATVVSVASDFKTTSTNAITFNKASGGSTGYCLKGENTAGTAKVFYWNSAAGGLTETAC